MLQADQKEKKKKCQYKVTNMDEISLITVEFLVDYIILTVILKKLTMINVIKACAKQNNDFSHFIGKKFPLTMQKDEIFYFCCAGTLISVIKWIRYKGIPRIL